MPQNLDEMQLCRSCRMNVFPIRPEFNIQMFRTFAISIITILIITERGIFCNSCGKNLKFKGN